jgi:hypothetical protein
VALFSSFRLRNAVSRPDRHPLRLPRLPDGQSLQRGRIARGAVRSGTGIVFRPDSVFVMKKRKKLRILLEKTFYASKLWEEMEFSFPF